MSVRRRTIKARMERERRWKEQNAATDASLEQLKRELPALVLREKLRAHGVELPQPGGTDAKA